MAVKTPQHKQKWIFVVLVAVAALVLDQLTKWMARAYLLLPGEDMRMRGSTVVELLPGCLNFNYAFNTGGAFSLMEDNFVMLTILSIIALSLLMYWIYATHAVNRWLWVAFGLIIGGAAGNLIDRFYWKGVVDFIQAYWKNYYWPTFNVADSAICAGMGIVIYLTVFRAELFDAPKAENQDLPKGSKSSDSSE